MNQFVPTPGKSMTPHDPACVAAADRFVATNKALKDRSAWAIRMEASVNLFLWHLDAFAKNEDPRPLFVNALDSATELLQKRAETRVMNINFPPFYSDQAPDFEKVVSGLFSDVWVDMTDDIYFDQSYEFTKERFEKNGIDPFQFFGGKVVVDGGCGSGKFSAAIARFGAKKVIGLDIGEKGLAFARKQAEKVEYGDRLDFRTGSLLNIPLEDESVDLVWSNGVIHHTLGYEKCISEFARILKKSGNLFLYVNGSFGLFELLQDKLREANADIPRALIQTYLKFLGVNSGRLYWLMDHLSAPYEWKSNAEVRAMLERNGFSEIEQMLRGVASDQIEQVTMGLPFADVKYGEAQLKYICTKS
jgi:ubiquinone/menaquinone biosynthesis C-methylase UbiE